MFLIAENYAVETVLKDHPIGHKSVVSQDRWPLLTGSITLKCSAFCQEYLAFQDRWSLMAVVAQDRFHCTIFSAMVPDWEQVVCQVFIYVSTSVCYCILLSLMCQVYKMYPTM